jgi:hypothetical protein
LIKKIGSEEMADGSIIRAWRLAQEFWKNEKGLIPLELFKALPFFQEIIDTKLANIVGKPNDNRTTTEQEPNDNRTEYIYVRGSSEYLDWVRQKREQAIEAGKKSAESRKEKSGSAQPNGGKGHKNKQEPNDNRTEVNGTEPSDSGSNSDSNSVVEVEEEKTPAAATPVFKNNSLAAFIAHFESVPFYSRLKATGAIKKVHSHYGNVGAFNLAYEAIKAKHEKKKPYKAPMDEVTWQQDLHECRHRV